MLADQLASMKYLHYAPCVLCLVFVPERTKMHSHLLITISIWQIAKNWKSCIVCCRTKLFPFEQRSTNSWAIWVFFTVLTFYLHFLCGMLHAWCNCDWNGIFVLVSFSSLANGRTKNEEEEEEDEGEEEEDEEGKTKTDYRERQRKGINILKTQNMSKHINLNLLIRYLTVFSNHINAAATAASLPWIVSMLDAWCFCTYSHLSMSSLPLSSVAHWQVNYSWQYSWR